MLHIIKHVRTIMPTATPTVIHMTLPIVPAIISNIPTIHTNTPIMPTDCTIICTIIPAYTYHAYYESYTLCYLLL